MEQNVRIIKLNDENDEVLYQYDTGQILEFDGTVEPGTHALMSNQLSKLSKRVLVQNNRAEIPNELLTVQGTLTVAVTVVDANSETTEMVKAIPIKHRKDADEEIAPKNQQTFIEQIQEVVNEAKATADDVQRRADDGEFNGKDGKDGAPGPKGDDYILTEADKEEIASKVDVTDMPKLFKDEGEPYSLVIPALRVGDFYLDTSKTTIGDINLYQAVKVTNGKAKWSRIQTFEDLAKLLADYVKTVNGIGPDSNGNIVLDMYNKGEIDFFVDWLFNSKQNKLVAGENIEIDENNVISAKGGSDEELREEVDVLWSLNEGNTFNYVTDNTEAHIKDVPQNAQKYARVNSIGGKSVVVDGEVVNNGVTEVASKGRNLLDIYEVEHPVGVTTPNIDIFDGEVSGTHVFSFDISDAVPEQTEPAIISYVEDGVTKFLGATRGSLVTQGTLTKITVLASNTYCRYTGTARFQLEKGDVSTEIVPPFEKTYPIPTSITSLDGYGWSAGNVCNEVDFKNKQYVQRVNKIVLNGTQGIRNPNWKPIEGQSGWLFNALTENPTKVTASNVVANITCDKLQANTYNALYTNNLGISNYNDDSISFVIRIGIPNLDTVAKVNAYLSENPITVYYEMAEPIITDLSSILTDDFIVEVEEGGSIEFVSDMGADVPSSVEYIVKSKNNVKINGVETVDNNINLGTNNGYYSGLELTSNGVLSVKTATKDNIIYRNGTSTFQGKYYLLNVSNMDYAIKSAMCDGKGASWTADEQKEAQKRLGIYPSEGVLFGE